MLVGISAWSNFDSSSCLCIPASSQIFSALRHISASRSCPYLDNIYIRNVKGGGGGYPFRIGTVHKIQWSTLTSNKSTVPVHWLIFLVCQIWAYPNIWTEGFRSLTWTEIPERDGSLRCLYCRINTRLWRAPTRGLLPPHNTPCTSQRIRGDESADRPYSWPPYSWPFMYPLYIVLVWNKLQPV